MRKTVILFLALALLMGAVGVAGAANNAEKQLAIDSGLAWLATQQNANGSWNNSQGYPQAGTAAALLAFTEQYYKPGGWGGADYSTNVINAANYLLNTAAIQPFNVPNYIPFQGTNVGVAGWTNQGLLWGSGEATYVTGLVVPALTRMINSTSAVAPILSPSTVITSGAATGLTYAQAIQKAMDSYIWGQTPPSAGNYQGGWRYVPNIPNTSDNSTTQWAAISFLYGQQTGATVPAATAALLKNWIGYIQNANGGAGYDSPGYLVNVSKTGGLLVEMAWAGGYPNTPGSAEAMAIAYLNGQWQTTANSTWDGNFGHPYAMWSAYKGLESTIGLNNTTDITNIHAQSGSPLDPGQTWNWWEDYCQSLVASQGGDGSWGGYSYWDNILTTAWDINILNGTRVGPAVPLPGTLGLLSTGLFGLLGAGWWRRRKN